MPMPLGAASIFPASGAYSVSTIRIPSSPSDAAIIAARALEHVDIAGNFRHLNLDFREVLRLLGRRQRRH
jgi:hypothetical protein